MSFTEVPVGSDGYQITFTGDLDMPVANAHRFALLRAAELAAIRDMPFFQITDEHIDLSYRVHYQPGGDHAIAPMIPDQQGMPHPVVSHVTVPVYAEPYTIPEVSLGIRLFAQSTDHTIPAAYLLRQAMADKIKLSTGVSDRVSSLPEVTGSVTLPPAPAPTTKPLG